MARRDEKDTPEFYGKSRIATATDGAINIGLLGGIGGAVIGAVTGLVAGGSNTLREMRTEVYQETGVRMSSHALGAVVFGVVGAVSVGLISGAVGWFLGWRKGEKAREQHKDLYRNLDDLEARLSRVENSRA